MNLNISKAVNKGLAAVKEHSPAILTVLGVTGMIGGTVMACRATTKLGAVMDDHQKRLQKSKKLDGKGKAQLYLKTAAEVTKLYAPAAAVTALSASSIFAGNSILRKRNLALAAAYTVVDEGFKKYRKNVVSRFGEEVDNELRHGLVKGTVSETVTTEDGQTKAVSKEADIMTGEPSGYAVFFNRETATGADPSGCIDYDLFFLKNALKNANDILRIRGYYFLNDAFDLLGIKRTVAGQSVGWVYDKNSADCGDNYIDFGIQVVYRPNEETGEYEKTILLDFNVDGNIMNRVASKGLVSK